MVSEVLWVQSLRRIEAASRSACKSASISAVLFVRRANGRRREAEGRIISGPRIASL
jgi:hypothetical protein